MKTEIQYLHFSPDTKLKDHVERKTSKLLSTYPWVTEGKIFLKMDKSDKQKNKIVEIHMNIPHDTIYSEARSESFTAACDEAVNAARKQLKKHKDKLYQHT